jgi:uncharacterized membrane protein YagU involved in acid resistance
VRWSHPVVSGIRGGALAGLVGGLVFGAAMIQLGYLPTVASIVRAQSPLVGFVVHMLIAALVGAGFGALVARQRLGVGETLFWGLAYGAFWWFLGPLTLLPLLLGSSLVWDVGSAQAAFPSLLGHLWYGASTGIALAVLRGPIEASGERARQGSHGPAESVSLPAARPARRGRGSVMRGALAGLGAAWLFGVLLDAQGQLAMVGQSMAADSSQRAWLIVWLVGLLAGVGFALLYPRPADGAGPLLVRGVAYGFAWWVAGGLTLFPLLGDLGLTWSPQAARDSFATLPGFLLFGATLALLYRWLDGLVRLLFSDEVRVREEEGAGTEALRALGRGALGGLVGGLLFTLVMLQVGFLETVASLVGGVSPRTGLLVHLAISLLIGASYGVLFHRQSFDVGSALGWGVSYGLFWWVLGPMTLLPMLLGSPPRWSAEVAAALLPSLVGHLAYGAGLGLVFYRFEARHAPWWVPRTRSEEARVARRREHLLTSAPALWALVVVIGLTLPVVLADRAATDGGYATGSGYGGTDSGSSGGYGAP